jgi:chromosome segregation ATPase
VEAQPQSEAQKQQAEQGSLAVSADDFSGLEQRILRAVELVKREREERGAAEARAAQAEGLATQEAERAAQAEGRAMEAETRAAQAETKLHEQNSALEQMQAELNALRGERDHVRQRVERLLKQLDGLEL